MKLKIPTRVTLKGNNQSISMVLDPLGDYAHINPHDIIEMCGLIPYFLVEVEETSSFMSASEMAEAVDEHYGYAATDYPFSGTIDELGRYQSEDDPVLSPLCRITKNGVDTFVYPYAIIGFVSNDESQYVCRMD